MWASEIQKALDQTALPLELVSVVAQATDKLFLATYISKR
jgi:hypothetical protein